MAAPLPKGRSLNSVLTEHLGEGLLEVGDQVVDVLGPDGDPDGGRVDVDLLELLLGQLGVGGGRGVDDQGLLVGDVGQEACSLVPLTSKVKMDPAPSGKYLLYRPWVGLSSRAGWLT